MTNLLDDNRNSLYNYLLSTEFCHTNPEICGDRYAKCIGVDVPEPEMMDKKYAPEFLKQGLPQWMGAHLVYFYDGIVKEDTSDYFEDPIEEKILHFNDFIWKIAKSITYRTKPWDVIEKNIKLRVLNALRQSVVSENTQKVAEELARNIDKAIKVCENGSGSHGSLVDIMNYYLVGVDGDSDEEILLREMSMGDTEYEQTISHAIIWSVFPQLKDTLSKRVPSDMSCSPPKDYLQSVVVQEIFVAEIRAK